MGSPTGGGPSRDWRVAWGKNCCRFGVASCVGERLEAPRFEVVTPPYPRRLPGGERWGEQE